MEQLIKYFKPEHYNLSLRINKHSGQVLGNATIAGEQVGPSTRLHAKNLNIKSVKIDDQPTEFQAKDDELQIKSTKGPKTITIDYGFNLNTNMEGAYLSSYQHQGQTEKIVTTQFESHYARQCFPCVDEPAAKATFDLAITVPDVDDTVISNMPVKSEQVAERKKIVEFETTPRMSTYLLAFCIGRFQSKSTTSLHGVKITTYAALNQSPKSLDFPTKVAADALDYYDDLFGIKYPLPKLDQVALPDFESGAMENWGLVTYRESCLLADKSTSISTREYVATVITHELSHQWFGNLVTMQWWDDLWLNESFASVMQYLAADAIRPEFKVWQGFFTGDCYIALQRDALKGVQAVQQPVHDPAEIATLFDGAIVYAKGARLILMLMRLMGPKQFFAGIKAYLKKYQYSNACAQDLWQALQPHAKFDVPEFMNAWVSQPGYPVIADGVQQRFLITGATDDTKWPLPKIQDDLSGHYILNLSGPEFEAALARFDKLNLEQRLRLLIDRQLLAKTPLVSAATLLDLLPAFRTETSDPVWNIVGTIMSDLKVFFTPETAEWQQYKKYVAQVITPQLQRIGVKPKRGEDANDTKLRSTINGFALYAEDQVAIQQLAKLYQSDYEALPPEIRDDILDAKLRTSKEEIFDELLAQYQVTANPNIRANLLGVFTNAKQPAHTKRLLQLLEQPEIVRPQDHIYLFINLLYNYKTKAATFQWLYHHWDYVRELTGEKSLDDYLRGASNAVRTPAEADQFFAFADPLSNTAAYRRTVEVAHASINARLRLLHDDQKAVYAKLAELTAQA